MRILHLLNEVSAFGNGIVNSAVDIACHQSQMGHQVAMASAGGDFVALLERFGVEHFTIEQRPKPQIAAKALIKLNGLFGSWKPDIVHGHMLTGSVIARLCQPLHRYRLVTTVHNEFKKSATLMGHANVMVAVSEENRKRLVTRGVPERRTTVVRNGVIGGARAQSVAQDLPELQHPSIVTVAGLFERKGVAEVIEAFGRLDEGYGAHLYIVGRGPERDKLEAMAAALPCAERIHFEGFKSNGRAYLYATDIFVLASHADPFPLVVPEAREAGCAIVGSQVGGITEALEDGARGILTPPKSPDALHAAFDRLLRDPKELALWRQRAVENLEWLTVARMTNDYMAVYDRALKGASRGLA
jgi:glycosyltransferase involved in cell wall biosynthesis